MKKFLSLVLSAFMIFGAVSCGSAGGSGSTAVDSIDELKTSTIVDLICDMTDLDLRASCDIAELTPDMTGYMIGYDGFSGEFESATSLAPRMMSIPFVLAVFRLNEGADAEAFAADIKANADPIKWVCVQADSIETRVSGRTVLFMMSPVDMVEPITTAFGKMSEAGFNPDEHLKQPLKGLSMADFYAALLEQYSADNYGFLDGKDTMSASESSDFGMDKLDSKLYTESLVDVGSIKSDFMNGSYYLAMFRLADGVSSDDFIKALRTNASFSDNANSIIAFTKDVVVLFAGTEDLGNYAIDFRYLFMNEYRMEITGLVELG